MDSKHTYTRFSLLLGALVLCALAMGTWEVSGHVLRADVGVCGDGTVNDGETCDDGNTLICDGCSDTCQVETNFTCTGQPSACEGTCGDGVMTGNEECDDGGTTNGDGCSAQCKIEHGFVCGAKANASVNACGSQLTTECHSICGDGIRTGKEVCDDGNTVNGDGCNSTCTKMNPGYVCHTAACTPVCGNGIREDGEQCDDGNTKKGDGCSAQCNIEIGYTCDKDSPCACAAKKEAIVANVHGAAPVFTQILAQKEVPAAIIDAMLNRLKWPTCTDAHVIKEYKNLSTPLTYTRGYVLARVAQRLCLPLDGGAPVHFPDFDPHMPYAQEMRILANDGIAIDSFDQNGNPTGKLEPDRPMTFLEVVALLHQLQKNGIR